MNLLLITILVGATLVDEIVLISLLIHTAQTTGSTLSVAGLMLAQLGPAIVFAPWAGRFVDQRGAKPALLIAGALQIPVLLAFAFSTQVWEIYLFSALLSAIFAITGPALFALIPSLTQQSGMSIERTNSLLEIVRGSASVAGPALGGLLIGVLSMRGALFGAIFWCVLLWLAVLFAPNDAPQSAADTGAKEAQRRSLSAVLRHRRLLVLFLTFGAIVFATSLSDVVFVFLVTNEFGGGPLLIGVLMGIWSLGLILGAWFAGKPAKEGQSLNQAYQGAIGMGGALVASALGALLAPPVAIIIVAIAFLAGGLSNGVHNVAVRNAIYRIAPKQELGRSFALYVSVSRIAVIAGYFGGGMVGSNNTVGAYAVSGIAALLAGAIGWAVTSTLSRRRALSPESNDAT